MLSLGFGALAGLAGIGIGGSLLSQGLNAWSANHAAHQNQRYAANQNLFQQGMFNQQVDLANTAHQREVKDLRAAGLNPILSATGGSGAAFPAAGAGQSGSIAQAAGGDINSAGNLAKELYKYWDSQKGNIDADTGTKKEVAKTEQKKQGLIDAQKDLVEAQFPEVESGAQLAAANNLYELAIKRAQLGDPSYFNRDYGVRKMNLLLPSVLQTAKVGSGMVNSAAFYHHATHRNRERSFSNGMTMIDNYF